jgi:hypothetical protein
MVQSQVLRHLIWLDYIWIIRVIIITIQFKFHFIFKEL